MVPLFDVKKQENGEDNQDLFGRRGYLHKGWTASSSLDFLDPYAAQALARDPRSKGKRETACHSGN
jgi:hypothetical protein